MAKSVRGRWEPLPTIALSGPGSYDLSRTIAHNLKAAVTDMTNPTITAMRLKFVLNVTTGGAAITDEQLHRVIQNLRLVDVGGEVINCSGQTARILLEHHERENYVPRADVAADLTTTNIEWDFTIDMDRFVGVKPDDYYLHARPYFDKGQLNITLQNLASSALVIHSGTVRVEMKMSDMGNYLRPRWAWREHALPSTTLDLTLNGKTRFLGLFVRNGATVAWTDITTLTSLTSHMLGYKIPTTSADIGYYYRKEVRASLYSATRLIGAASNMKVLPLIWQPDQSKLSDERFIGTLTGDLTGTLTANTYFAIEVIVPRSKAAAASEAIAQSASVGEMVGLHGRAIGLNGKTPAAILDAATLNSITIKLPDAGTL